MGKLILAELMKLRKSTGYKVLFLCALGLGLFVSAMTTYIVNDFIAQAEIPGLDNLNITTNGYMMFLTLVNDPQTNVILISIFAAIFICGEFSDRTYGVTLYSGVSRWKVLLSKILTYMAAILPMIFIYPVSGMLVAASRYGFGTAPSGLPWICLRLILAFAAVASFCVLISVLIKNVGGVIGACIGGTMVLSLLNAFQRLEPVTKFSFMYQITRIQTGGFLFAGVMTVTAVVAIVLSLLLFERAELK